MPTGYSYLIPSAGSATLNSREPSKYAFTPRIDPFTRDLIMRDSRVDRGDPAVELVLMTLATPLGSFLPDRSIGVDYNLLTKATPNVSAKWKAAIESALARYIPSRITKLEVAVDPPRKNRLVYSVSFVDPRSNDHLPIALPLAVQVAA